MLGALRSSQIDRLLSACKVGRIGCSNKGLTYVVPVSYVFDDGYIYCFTKEGMKIESMRANPTICFEVDEIDNLMNWRSVIIQGTYEELKGEAAREGMNILATGLAPYGISETAQPKFGLDKGLAQSSGSQKPVAFRIKVEERTGRFEKRLY